MRKYRILELVITRDQTRNALHAPSRSLQESPQEGTAGTEPRLHAEMHRMANKDYHSKVLLDIFFRPFILARYFF